MLFLLVSTNIFAQTENPEKKEFLKIKYEQTYFSISPLVSPRICIGLVNPLKRDDDHYLESIFYVHAFDTFSTFKCYGIAFKGNTFLARNKRHGVYVPVTGGFDYVQYEPFCFNIGGGDCDRDIETGIFPNITFGLGYSFIIKNDYYFRLELDFGLKWFISNIYISYVW